MIAAVLLIAAALAPTTLQDEPGAQASPAAKPLEATVLFDDDSSFSGPIAVAQPGGLLLEVDEYDEPATVDLDVVTSLVVKSDDARVTWPIDPESGMDMLTLRRRQLLRGRIVDVRADLVTFVSPRFGRLQIPAEQCGDLLPPAVADSGVGVSPLWNPWMSAAGRNGDLRVVDDVLRLNGRGAVAARSCMESGGTLEFELEWKGKPEFKIHVGGDHRDDPPTGVVLQPWDGALVLFTFNGEDLDLVPTGLRLRDDSSIVLRIGVDDEFVRLTSAEYPDGTVVPVETKVARRSGGGVVALEALGRPMSIRRTRITGGIAPTDGSVRVERPILLSEVKSFDSAQRDFSIEAGRVPFDRSLGIRMAWGGERGALSSVDPAQGFFRVTCRDGEAIEAADLRFVNGGLRFRPRWSLAEVDLPLDQLWHLRRRARQVAANGERAELIVEGRSEVGVRLSGLQIEEGGLRPVLQIYGFTNTVRLEEGVAFTLKRSMASTFHAARRTFPHVLVLRDGQMFPARVARATEDTLFVETPFHEGEAPVPSAAVKAVLVESSRAMRQFQALEKKKESLGDQNRRVFINGGGTQPQRDPTVIDEARLGRALLVPRNQKDDPGTHLFVAKNGDLMRANLVSLSEETVTVRGGSGPNFQFPMELLASWVCVTPDAKELDPKEPDGAPRATWQVELGASNLIRGQALLLGRPLGVEGNRIQFEHAALGRLSITIEDISQIDHVDRAQRRSFVFDEWKTRPMPDPEIICEDDGGQ